MTCNKCGTLSGCGCSPQSSPATPPISQPCNELPAQLITCFSGQSLPPELPTSGIPAAAVAYRPPAGACVPETLTVHAYLDKIADLYFSLFCPESIAATPGSCSILAVKNNKVIATTFQALFNTCLACIEPKAICAGNPGDTLQTVGGVAVWAPPNGSGVAVEDSATVYLALTGSTVRAQVILDSNPLNLATETPDGVLVLPMSCTEIKSAIETGACIPDGTITKSIGFSSTGGLVKSAPSIGGGSALDCNGFQSLLSGCPPVASSVVPTSFIALNANSEPQKFSVCPLIKATVNRSQDPSTGGCLDDMAGLTSRVLGYDEVTKEAKWVLAKQRYMAELRGSITAGQILPTTPQNLNNVDVFWASGGSPTYERGIRGGTTWFNASTGRFTIVRPGWYRASLIGLMVRVRAAVAAGIGGHVYAGITVVRAGGVIDGTAYPPLVGILRTGESPVEANGKNQDFVFSGEYFGPLNAGDQLWVRVVCANVPDTSFAITSLEVLDDGKASFTLAEEPMYMATL